MPIAAAFGFFALLEEIAYWTTAHCQPFEPTWVAHALAVTRYSPLLTTLVCFAVGLFYADLYLLLFGVGATFNGLVNLLLRALVADHRRAAPLCSDAYGLGGNWPSYQAQDAAFLALFLSSYCVVYGARVPLLRAALLALFYSAVIAGDALLNQHTTSQIVGGVVAGLVWAAVWQVAVRLVVVPMFPRLLALPVVRWARYNDTMLGVSSAAPKLD